MSLGSTFAQNADLDSCYGSGHATSVSGSSAFPSSLFVRLYVGNPMSGGTELTSAGGYAPVSVTNNSTNWPNASGGQKMNGVTFTFPTSTAAWSGNPTYFWLTDSTPNLLDGGPLTGPVIVPSSGYVVSFAAGAIVITAS